MSIYPTLGPSVVVPDQPIAPLIQAATQNTQAIADMSLSVGAAAAAASGTASTNSPVIAIGSKNPNGKNLFFLACLAACWFYFKKKG